MNNPLIKQTFIRIHKPLHQRFSIGAGIEGRRILQLASVSLVAILYLLNAGCKEETEGTDEKSTTVSDWLEDWPEDADPETVGKLLASRVEEKETRSDTFVDDHYKNACAWYGALQISQLTDDDDMTEALCNAFGPHYMEELDDILNGPGNVDANVFGIVPFEIYKITEDEAVLEAGVELADHQIDNKDAGSQKRYAVDDMFMVIGLQVQAYRATANDKYLDFAGERMVEYLDLQQDDGLFFQLNGNIKNNTVKWGRGNGWFASGMTEILQELPSSHDSYKRIRQGYDDMMNGLLEYQIKDGDDKGMWKQVLDYDGDENWAESSGTAMFAFSMITGLKKGWLSPDKFGSATRDAWLALVDRLEEDGRLRDISNWCYFDEQESYLTSEGRSKETNDALTVLGDDHGQAPMMWAAAALLRPTESDE